MAQKARCVTCNDCFFRKTSLCALDLSEPCPTFRPALKGRMVAPRQPRLVEPTTTFTGASRRERERLAGGDPENRAWWRRELDGAPLAVQLPLEERCRAS